MLHITARVFPSAGSGAVTLASGRPMKQPSIPSATAIRYTRSRRLKCSFKSSGPRSTRYSGAVDCRKIAFADVVSFVDNTNNVTMAA